MNKPKYLLLTICAAMMLVSCSHSSESEKQTVTETQSVSATAQTSASTTASQTSSASKTAASTSSSTAGTTSASTAETMPTAASADRTKPTIFTKSTTVYHLAGTAFDLNNYISYGDDTDRHPRLSCTGKVDTNKPGDNPIKATVTDASGNTASHDFTVKVVTTLPKQQTPHIPSMTFDAFKARYKADNTRFGIDVSQWQGNIDFKAVKNAGCTFAFIRVGTKFSSFTLDPYFKQNLEGALAAGLDVGVYLYTTDHTEQSARESAKWVAAQLGGKKLTLPVAFDWEELDGFQNYGASINDVNRAYIAFKNELAQNGYSSMLYGSVGTFSTLWLDSVKASSPVWLAQYTDKPTYNGDFGIWQVCYGRIAGISANTDFNVLYTNKRYK
ncbi:MAG: DUF5011 domain-containing protein [Ruminococcus sp.]|nr:DUF5011 domain-containing protein [Ruminococcus sp.]